MLYGETVLVKHALTFLNLIEAERADPRHLVALVLQGCSTLRAIGADCLATSSAVVASLEDCEVRVAPLTLGNTLIWHPNWCPLSEVGAL